VKSRTEASSDGVQWNYSRERRKGMIKRVTSVLLAALLVLSFSLLAFMSLTPTMPAMAADYRVAVYGAPSTSSWNDDVQGKLDSSGLFSQVDAFLVRVGPVPTLSELQQYDAVLVYSDASFNDSVALGDVLADYMDAGGGVVMATFAFWTPGGLGIGGRISTGGYLPFTQASQNEGTPLTLVADLPSHPILNGVSSFNGGTSSYHNTIELASGATLIAHWSNGYPLVGTKEPTAGRIVGLNLYPPSSDARADFWDSSTAGGLLMANSLLWASGGTPMAPRVAVGGTAYHVNKLALSAPWIALAAIMVGAAMLMRRRQTQN
jgi:hypothetical protein